MDQFDYVMETLRRFDQESPELLAECIGELGYTLTGPRIDELS